jgi:hypothetical protein
MPNFLQFPSDSLLTERRILIVDDVWAVAARARPCAAGSKRRAPGGYLCLSLQPLPVALHPRRAGLLRGRDRRLHRLPLGAGSRRAGNPGGRPQGKLNWDQFTPSRDFSTRWGFLFGNNLDILEIFMIIKILSGEAE